MARRLDEVVRPSGVVLVPAGKRHVRELARAVREEDRAEVWASGRLLPEQAARASVNRSTEAWAAYVGGDLLAVLGVTAFPNGWASPWLISTQHVPAHARAFFVASRLAVEHLRSAYPRMVQMVHGRYSAALRWLARLGFRVEEPVPFGRGGEFFCRVTLETRAILYQEASHV